MYEPNTASALALIDSFRVDHVGRPLLIDYLEHLYFKEDQQQRWMLCFRQDISTPAIDTNNHVESWHNSLKTHFFKDQRKRRPDAVIFIMVKSVIPFYQRKLYHSSLNVGRMNPVQRSERDARIRAETYMAKQRSLGYSGQFVFGTEERCTIRVRSFKDNLLLDPQGAIGATFYDIHLDFKRDILLGEIIGCTCQGFRLAKACCQHIALVVIDKSPIKYVRHATAWEQADEAPVDPLKVETLDAVVKIPTASKAKIRRHTKGFLDELKGICSKSQFSDEDRDVVACLQELYDKFHSMGLTHGLNTKRKRQTPK